MFKVPNNTNLLPKFNEHQSKDIQYILNYYFPQIEFTPKFKSPFEINYATNLQFLCELDDGSPNKDPLLWKLGLTSSLIEENTMILVIQDLLNHIYIHSHGKYNNLQTTSGIEITF